MKSESDDLAEVIAFPGAQPASTDREDSLTQLRARMAATEAEYAPDRAAAQKPTASKKRPTLTNKPGRSVEFAPKAEADEGDTDTNDNVSTMPGVSSSQAADRDEASNMLVRALGRSAKSVREAEKFLAEQTELGIRDREQIIHHMIDLNYLDDARLAEQLMTGSLSRKGLGSGGISRELRKRGIDESIVQDALAGFDRDTEFDRAVELAQERASRFRGLDDDTARRRLYGYLARRGFGGDIVTRAINEALS
ncbi:MAG: regulatory protein RecX [Gulosibacter sp.]|uniref:regulatory protein RecX n=1 Tax=Gulosibacter sp. TaxID=2817531 RepID=UPI003F924FED